MKPNTKTSAPTARRASFKFTVTIRQGVKLLKAGDRYDLIFEKQFYGPLWQVYTANANDPAFHIAILEEEFMDYFEFTEP